MWQGGFRLSNMLSNTSVTVRTAKRAEDVECVVKQAVIEQVLVQPRRDPRITVSELASDDDGRIPATASSTGCCLLSRRAEGSAWGGTAGQAPERAWTRALNASPKSLLFGHLRAVPGRIVTPLTRPVTPEVSGSSPVAPVSPFPCKAQA